MKAAGADLARPDRGRAEPAPLSGLRRFRAHGARSAYAQLRYSPLRARRRRRRDGARLSRPAAVRLFGAWPCAMVRRARLGDDGGQPRADAAALWPLAARRASLLPAIAAVYVAFTLQSAVQFWRGRGGYWKGRFQAPMRRGGAHDDSDRDASGKTHATRISRRLVADRRAHRAPDPRLLPLRARGRRRRRPSERWRRTSKLRAARRPRRPLRGARRAAIRGRAAARRARRTRPGARGMRSICSTPFASTCASSLCRLGGADGLLPLSAMPVGRFVLDVHGEDEALWPASDALCARCR